MNLSNVMKMRARFLRFNTLILLALLLIISCTDNQIPALPSKAPLLSAIDAANTLVTTTFEGAATTNYLPGSRLALKNAIVVAQKVYILVQPTQDQLTTAINDLNAAVDVYKSKATPAVDPTNLLGQWTFDQVTNETVTDSPVKDYSGNGNNGLTKRGHDFWGRGTPSLGTDRFGVAGRALHFTYGANVEIPYVPAFNSPAVSISLWLRSDVNSPVVGNQFVISLNRSQGYVLKFDTDPKILFSSTTSQNPTTSFTYNNGSTLSQGAWYHVVATFGDGHVKFYVNGLMVKDEIQSGTMISQTAPTNLVFGQDLPTSAYSTTPGDPHYLNDGGYYLGYLDEIRLYKSVLTQEMVLTIYTIEKPQ